MITRAEIEQAQQRWGEGVVHIGQVHIEGGDVQAAAAEHVDELYGYGMGVVLFKPTKVAKQPFRLTREGAISYFVGGNPDFPEDHGFALQPWSAVCFKSEGMRLRGDSAIDAGHYYFTGPDGIEVEVEYTFEYERDDEGSLRIVAHHSSLPYNPEH